MTALIRRNVLVFFRDRATVFFSLLSVLLIILLYVLFLGDMMVRGIDGGEGTRFLVDSWIMAGLLAVTTVTSTQGAFGTMVDDKSRKVINDFTASPLSRRALAAGYVFSSFLIGVIMSVVALVAAQIYIVVSGGALLPPLAALKLLGALLLSVLSSSAMVFFMVSFFSSMNAFGTASTLIGTLIGFLTGIYIPIGSLPEGVGFVIKVFPVSHSAALLRQIMMDAPMTQVFKGAPAETVRAFQLDMGVKYSFGGYTSTALTSIIVLALTAALFYTLAIFNISKKNR